MYLTITGRQCLFNKHILCLHKTGSKPFFCPTGCSFLVAGRLQSTWTTLTFCVSVRLWQRVVIWITLHKASYNLIFKCNLVYFSKRLYGVHSCEIWDHAITASRVRTYLFNLVICKRNAYLIFFIFWISRTSKSTCYDEKLFLNCHTDQYCDHYFLYGW